jgi:hypothetical protein
LNIMPDACRQAFSIRGSGSKRAELRSGIQRSSEHK